MQSDLDLGSAKFRRNIVLLSAVIGFGVSLFIWATALMSMASLAEGQLDTLGSQPAAWDCDSGADTLSLEQEVQFLQECATPTPEATATPAATPTPVRNRLDCEAIRGTNFFSPAERTWFLDSCVR